MANKIIGTMGQLGAGKTFFGVIWIYDGFCQKLPTGTNIPVTFPSKPLKTLEDIALNSYKEFYDKTGLNGRDLLDELWKLADNRKCMSLMSDLVDIILLKSRKQHRDIFYSQQFLQIDPRIAYITNEWISPTIFGVDKNKPISKENLPDLLIIDRCDNYFNDLTPRQIDLKPYLNLFDSDDDPYIIKEMCSEENIRKIIARLKENED